MPGSMVHDQLESTSTHPWRTTDSPPTTYLNGADTPDAPVPPSRTLKQPQQQVLPAAPAIQHKLPASLRSRTQNAPPMHDEMPRWLVLTPEPVFQSKVVASVFSGLQKMPSAAAATTHVELHDGVLEPFLPRTQGSFPSIGAIALEDVQGRSTAETPWLLLN